MNCKKRTIIPTLLHELIEEASRARSSTPNFECRAGWCQQCQCSESSLVQKFGELEYIVQPTMPPVDGAILPCVARRRVPSFSVEELLRVCIESEFTQSALKRKAPVYAKSVGNMAGKIYSVSSKAGAHLNTFELASDSVLIKLCLTDPPGVSESVISQDKFVARYGVVPSGEFSEYFDCVGVDCFVVTSDLIRSLEDAMDGEAFVKFSNQVFSIVEGDVISLGGGYMKRERLARDFVVEPKVRDADVPLSPRSY